MSNVNTPIASLAITPITSQNEGRKFQGSGGTFFEALARAWGAALDRQATRSRSSRQGSKETTRPRRSRS